MANATIKHAFTSAVPDGGDTSLVQPSNWNADHTVAAGGSDTHVQFNDSGAVNGDAGLTYDKTTGTLAVTALTVDGNALVAGVVANIAALRANNGTLAGPTVQVIGYRSATTTSAPDGGGGLFVLDAADTVSADDGGVVIVDAGGQRWKRVTDNAHTNVLWFGARGDYTVGGVGVPAANTVAFQAALDYIAAGFLAYDTEGLSTLYVPAGAYVIDGQLVQKSTVHWKGAGKQNYSSGMRGGTTLAFSSLTDSSGIFLDGTGGGLYNIQSCTWEDMELWSLTPTNTLLQHAIEFNGGAGYSWLSQGGMYRVQLTGWTGYGLYWKVVADLTSYFQNFTIMDVSSSNIGGLFGSDPYAGLTYTMMTVINFNHENVTNVSAGRQPAFFDCRQGRETYMRSIVYEGDDSTDCVMRTGMHWHSVNNMHIELSARNPDCLFEMNSNYAGQLQLTDVSAQNLSTVAEIRFVEAVNSVVRLDNCAIANGNIRNLVEWNADESNRVHIVNCNFRPDPELDYMDRYVFENLGVVSTTGSPAQILHFTKTEEPFLAARGQWLDGLRAGPVTLLVDNMGTGDLASTASFGMKTDANEGRVFEMVSETDTVPCLGIQIAPLPEMVNNQVTVAVRYYVESTQDDVQFTGLQPYYTIDPDGASVYAQSSDPQFADEGLGPHNKWITAWATYRIGDTTEVMRFYTGQRGGGPGTPSGVTKIRIGGVYVGLGHELPYMIGAGNPGAPIEWTAAAAPAYGAYIVGDRVWNSVPGSGDPLGWVCTVSGSPGTWVEMAAGGSVAGTDTQVQFNDGGAFGGDSGLTYNKTTKALNLGGATVTADAPVLNLTQTWNNAAVTFNGKSNDFTDTASASGSLLERWQVGGSTLFGIGKTYGNLQGGFFGQLMIGGTADDSHASIGAAGAVFKPGASLMWSNGTVGFGTPDLIITRDGANIFAQRSGTNGQTFRVYNTYTDASNYEHGKLSWNSNVLEIGTEKAGTGTARAMALQTDGTTRATVGAAGGLAMAAANTFTTGAYTVSTLPAAGTVGRLAHVTDGDASLAWGATVVNTGSGATKYLCWDNGTAWTVAGK